MRKLSFILFVLSFLALSISADPFTEGYMQGYRDALAGRPNRFLSTDKPELFKVTYFVDSNGNTTDRGYVGYARTPKGLTGDGKTIRWNIVADQSDISFVIWDEYSRQLRGNAKFPPQYDIIVSDLKGTTMAFKGSNYTDRIQVVEKEDLRALLYSGADFSLKLREKKESGGVEYDLGKLVTEGFQEVYFTMMGIHIAEGPSGGYIFYDKGYYSDGWRYLEAAPADLHVVDGMISVDNTRSGYADGVMYFPFGYCRESANGHNQLVGTSTEVGSGSANTKALVQKMGESAYTANKTLTPNYAANLCSKLVYGGADDWFLPSRDELNLLYSSLRMVGIGNLEISNYWSSSENNKDYAWSRNFSGTEAVFYDRKGNMRIRPIRAF